MEESVCPSASVMVATALHDCPLTLSEKSPATNGPPKRTTTGLPVLLIVTPPQVTAHTIVQGSTPQEVGEAANSVVPTLVRLLGVAAVVVMSGFTGARTWRAHGGKMQWGGAVLGEGGAATPPR